MAKPKYILDDYARQLILERYDSSTKRINELQRTLGVPRGMIHKWASTLGVTRHSYRRWKVEELAYLEQHVNRQSPARIAEHLGRSRTAVQARMRIMGLDVPEGYTLIDVRDGMGVAQATAVKWVNRGWLKGTRSAYDATTWNFTDAQIRDFLRRHPEEIDLAKVDQLWFLDICLDLGSLSCLIDERKKKEPD